jgi:restriction system protein
LYSLEETRGMSERKSGAVGGPAQPERVPRLRPSGGYRTLRSFQVTTIIYDATVSFCARFLDRRSRTVDQMVQAARSGRQNIAEGSRASAVSSQTELRLVSVARASLDELLLDYEDFLRQRGQRQWDKNDREAQAVRAVGREPRPSSAESADAAPYARWLNHADPAMAANAVICLIHQANYLLDQQIAALERDFIREGGYSENLAAARLAERDRQRQLKPGHRTDRTDRTDLSDARPLGAEGTRTPPACPACGKGMVLRTARKGSLAGSRFWGCAGYPGCTGTRPGPPVGPA